MVKTYKLLAYLVVIIFLASCGSSDEEEINLLLDKRVRSFQLKDPEMYSECIHEDYRATSGEKVVDKHELVSRFKDQVSTIDTVSFGESERYIYINGTDARVMMLSSIDVKIGSYSMTYKAREVINLSKVLGKWRITKESMLNLLSGTMILDN
ncbi:MAG: hypothetical protein F4235_01425 [Candidatus Dadabacteria bacterium]|nr:hypothetical protein [Candidatus Dadabacteria bacterium]MYE60739.1 hypothetical protein [Candidatus Dadabacteria bacterium]MYI73318.1 hypothetical protein [Candidatus Dadabacteria bacterium]